MVKKAKNNKIRCEKCGSNFGYVRIKKKEFQCRDCLHVTKLKEDQDHGKKGE